MSYQSLRECVDDLEKHGQLARISKEVDPHLEMAEIHRQSFREGGPAVYFEKIKGSAFPAVSNLYGTQARCEYLFRKTLPRLQNLFSLKANPALGLKQPFKSLKSVLLAAHALPKKVSSGPVLECTTTIDQLPQIVSWPKDGGPFILLPQVYTEDIENPGILKSNLGMYRVQIGGNEYEPNKEVGLHYQIRRDIGIHHTNAVRAGKPMRVSIFVGGPPAHAFSAVMYLPEGLPEVAFAGALGGRRFRYCVRDGFVISADADFCITGWVDPKQTKPEGPFGDHLGYYSLKHNFPVLKIEKVYHRKDAIWPFTIVGRPPQEDSSLGALIQKIAGPVIPKEIPGIKAVHAVDAAGVHPLLLAIGKERYLPYEKRKPRELLTSANALLGYGPCSLAKYLFIVSAEDAPDLDVHDIPSFLKHFLERVDWKKDLHFQTMTTMDSLDYSGHNLHEGSKVVLAAAGEKQRELIDEMPADIQLPELVSEPKFVMPGVLVFKTNAYQNQTTGTQEMKLITDFLKESIEDFDGIPLILLADDSEFTAENLNNFLWVTFTRSNPATDIGGIQSFTEAKHWGCRGSLIIDVRVKSHHAPVLEPDVARASVPV